MSTDGEAIPRMKDGNLKPGLSCRFYPWYCLAIRGSLSSLRLLLFNSFGCGRGLIMDVPHLHAGRQMQLIPFACARVRLESLT